LFIQYKIQCILLLSLVYLELVLFPLFIGVWCREEKYKDHYSRYSYFQAHVFVLNYNEHTTQPILPRTLLFCHLCNIFLIIKDPSTKSPRQVGLAGKDIGDISGVTRVCAFVPTVLCNVKLSRRAVAELGGRH